MDKIIKFLRKLSSTDTLLIERALIDLKGNNLDKYDVKKLTGHHSIFRMRVGSVRIIFKRVDEKIDILDIGRRSEKTYREY